MKRNLLAIAMGLMVASVPAVADCVGQGDLNADGIVNDADLIGFAWCMGGPGTAPPGGCDPQQFARADFDNDGDLDLADFAQFSRYAGRTYFVYGPHRENLEAEMLAMALTGQLRAPEEQYQRIRRDLTLIRQVYPQLTTVIDDPDYVPNQLMVSVNPAMPGDNYRALNAYYLVISEQRIFGNWWLLTFCDNLNAEVLAGIYEALTEVDYADPNGLIGIDDYITVTVVPPDTYRYHIDDGFWDCFDGCDCHREWLLDVSAQGVVTLIYYREWGMPWCEF